jgi:HlyD family secretion protein
MRVTVDEAARTRVKDRYVVGAPLTGDLLRVELRAGDKIAKGAVLARLMPMASPLLDPRTRAEAAGRLAAAGAAQRQGASGVALAEVALEHAKKEAGDARRLLQSGTISPDRLNDAEIEERLRQEQLASARFGVQVADHDVEIAAAALRRVGPDAKTEQLDVTAPAPGIVLRVLRESAGVVQAGTPLLEIGDPAALEVTSDVLTSDAISIKAGAHVDLERWGGTSSLAAHVRLVEPAAFTRLSALGVEEQRVNVVMDLDASRDVWSSLGDGFRLDARIVVWEHKDVLTLPSSAVFRAKNGWAVYVVEAGRARLVRVEIGHRNDAQVEVMSGALVGATVVVHPGDRLKDGVRVEPR